MSSALLESLNSWFGSRSRGYEGLFKFNNLDSRVQKHLSRVYALLAFSALVSAVGCYAHISLGINGIITQVGAFACLLGVNFIRNDHGNQSKRLACLGGFAFCQGAALGPLVGLALFIQPTVVLLAFVSTATVFVCFSLAALTTQRRAYLYLGGWLAAATSTLLMLRLGSYFLGRSASLYNLELYGGLLMFAAYVLYDTQLIVERASAGDMDEIRHSVDLFVDFVALFARILIILLKNQEKENERRRQEERRRR